MTAGTFVAKYSNDPSLAREVRGDPLLNKLLSLIKIFRRASCIYLVMATRRPSKNSGRLIPDNCYHGHGLCGARLQITATSCLHPYTVVTALLVGYFLKGFPRCPYPRRRVPLSLVRNCVYRNVAEYIKLPSLLEAGKFMVGLCSGFGKYCFFQSNVLAVKRERERKRE